MSFLNPVTTGLKGFTENIHTFIPSARSLLSVDDIEEKAESLVYKIYTNHKIELKLLIFLVYYVVGVLVFHHFEGWSILECVYFITTAVTTVGYGAFSPSIVPMRLFIIPYEIIGVTLILRFCNELVTFCLISAQDEIIISFKRWLRHAVTRKDIRDGRVCLSIATMLICLLSGTLFFWGNEHWTLLNAFYWASCTMTASCFGDLQIKNWSSQIFSIFYIYACVFTFLVTFNNSLEAWLAAKFLKRREETIAALSSTGFHSDWANNLLGSDGRGCTRDAFTLAVLLEMGLINQLNDVDPIVEKFDLLDDGDKRYLTRKELARFRQGIRCMLRPTSKDLLGALEISMIADEENENTGNPDYQAESYDSDGTKYELSSYHQQSQVLLQSHARND